MLFNERKFAWSEILKDEVFQNWLQHREISDYQLEFIRQGYYGENLHTVAVKATMPFGIHKDKLLSEVPKKYLEWCLEQDWIDKWSNLGDNIKALLQELNSQQVSQEDIKNILHKI